MSVRSVSSDAIAEACHLLAQGEVVAIPTETVYGLAADATQDHAVAKIYAVKDRPEFNPLIIHCHSIVQANIYVELSEQVQELEKKFWPGPLTLVLKRRSSPLTGNPISLLTSAGLDTLAIRIPSHPVALELLRAYGKPLAAPSANLSQTMSPTCAHDVFLSLGSKVPLILDGGQTAVGLESTILDLSTPEPTLLRPGGIPLEDLQKILPTILTHQDNTIKAPGMMKRHYAPNTLLRLNATDIHPGELVLGFGLVDCDLNLSSSGNLEEAASNLFRMLRILDQRGAASIAVSPIPNHGLGLAINDRLTRAACQEEIPQ